MDNLFSHFPSDQKKLSQKNISLSFAHIFSFFGEGGSKIVYFGKMPKPDIIEYLQVNLTEFSARHPS